MSDFMVCYDVHFIPHDAVPLVLDTLIKAGFKIKSHKSVHHSDRKSIESFYPDSFSVLSVKYHV